MNASFWSLLLLGMTTFSGDLPTEITQRGEALAESPLQLELKASPLAVTFTNRTKEPLRILKPVDGSEWSWIMPNYRLTITDKKGKDVKLVGRCKLFGLPYSDTRWPDDYLVTIPPGESYTHKLSLIHDIPIADTYTLRFQYIFLPGKAETPALTYPPGLWQGEATSNTLTTRLAPER